MPRNDTLYTRENWQTPEQHAAGLEFQMAHDSGKRKLCDFMQFWRLCADKTCLRSRGCLGNPHSCFGFWWPHVPEIIKDEVRALIAERAGEHEVARIYWSKVAYAAAATDGAAEAAAATDQGVVKCR